MIFGSRRAVSRRLSLLHRHQRPPSPLVRDVSKYPRLMVIVVVVMSVVTEESRQETGSAMMIVIVVIVMSVVAEESRQETGSAMMIVIMMSKSVVSMSVVSMSMMVVTATTMRVPMSMMVVTATAMRVPSVNAEETHRACHNSHANDKGQRHISVMWIIPERRWKELFD